MSIDAIAARLNHAYSCALPLLLQPPLSQTRRRRRRREAEAEADAEAESRHRAMKDDAVVEVVEGDPKQLGADAAPEDAARLTMQALTAAEGLSKQARAARQARARRGWVADLRGGARNRTSRVTTT